MPKITGMSRIEAAYEESDRRRFFVPCPTCREFAVLRFSQLRWPKGQPDKAVYVCQHCARPVARESHRDVGRQDGRIPSVQPVLTGGLVFVGDAAEQLEQAQKNPALLPGEARDWKRLYDRREQYKIGTVPRGGVFLTAGAHVQKDCIEGIPAPDYFFLR